MKKYIKKLWCIFGMTMVSLFTCGVATYAWFSSYMTNKSGGMGIEADVPNLNLEYTIYKYNSSYELISSQDPSDLSFLPYDAFLTENNVYDPIIVEFNLAGQRVASKTGTLDFTISCTQAAFKTNYLSNIVEFAAKPLEIDTTDPLELYNKAVEELTDTYRFATDSTKASSLDIYVSLDDYASLVTEEGTLKVYMKLNYSEYLIETNFGNFEVTTEEAGGYIDFENDLTEILIK